MNRSQPRQRGRARRPIQPFITNPSKAIHRILNGASLRPNPDPPRIVARPWNDIVVVVENPTETYDISQLRDDLSKQLLNSAVVPEPNLEYDFQLEDVRLWGTTDVASAGALRGRFYGLLESQTAEAQIISSQEDRPAANQRAVLGFRWPESHQRAVLISTAGYDLFNHTNAVLAYVHVRWRVRPTDTPSPLSQSTRVTESPVLGTGNGVSV